MDPEPYKLVVLSPTLLTEETSGRFGDDHLVADDRGSRKGSHLGRRIRTLPSTFLAFTTKLLHFLLDLGQSSGIFLYKAVTP